MSLKWQRAKRWDDEHIPSWAWPAKKVLRAFSSIRLAICLLSFVVVYSTLASVPIGLLALIPTWIVYGLTLLAAVLAVGVLPPVGLWKALRGVGRAWRFAIPVLAAVVLIPVASLAWYRFAWPALYYDPATGEGLRLFADFVSKYDATTLRRLPGFEMTELEFYGWWPLRLVLFAFVINMITATVRRIEFRFENIGVLTVHTGIVVIALGSIYYTRLKQEGVAILWAGQPDPQTFEPTTGRPTTVFYDNIAVAIYVSHGGPWEQRPIRDLPRYNDYNLDVVSAEGSTVGSGLQHGAGADRPLSREVAEPRNGSRIIDGDVDLRVVGYASYAEPRADFVEVELAPGEPADPFRLIEMPTAFPDESGRLGESSVAFRFPLRPARPAERVHRIANAGIAVEYTIDMPEWRDEDLTEPLPPGTRHALVVEVPGARSDDGTAFREVYPVTPGRSIEVGETGYAITVEQLLEEPPFPIITPGYRGATSSLAMVEVEPPDGETFTRWVYHRFPEISQDLLPNPEGGRPERRDADPAIRIGYIDADRVQVYLDESSETGNVRAIVRLPRGNVRTMDLGDNLLIDEFVPREDPLTQPKVDLRVARRWTHAEPIEVPRPVPEEDRERELIGSHEKSMVAVEVSLEDGSFSETLWIPFSPYPGSGFGPDDKREVRLPDGRRLELMFGRKQHPFREFVLQLVDFEMLAYDHRGAPRDYQSTVRVTPTGDADFKAYTHVAKLNAPLKAPFMPSEDRSLFANLVGRLASGLDPNQYKLSQAKWDAGNWRRTQQLADEGQIPRPFVQWTVLGVGNNPGIHIIALGSVLVAVGIPWAFYVKPAILRHRKRRIQAEVAAGTYAPPDGAAAGGSNGEAARGAASEEDRASVGAQS